LISSILTQNHVHNKVIIKNLEYNEREKNESDLTKNKVQGLLRDGLGLANVQIKNASRKESRGKYPDVVVVDNNLFIYAFYFALHAIKFLFNFSFHFTYFFLHFIVYHIGNFLRQLFRNSYRVEALILMLSSNSKNMSEKLEKRISELETNF
jgi:hypothetical protein